MKSKQKIFVSYNSSDREWARKFAGAMTLAGANVWFDEWIIRPGDSIQTEVSKGLSSFDVFALVWSDASAKSRWVQCEMEAALTRYLNGDPCRLVPVCLGETELPILLDPLRYLDARDGDHIRAAREMLGLESEAAFRMAVQDVIGEVGLDFHEYPGVGVLVGCPRCGATPDKLKGWYRMDDARDSQHFGAYCTGCGWEDGSEV